MQKAVTKGRGLGTCRRRKINAMIARNFSQLEDSSPLAVY